jgi:signal transduction histidine kinase
MVRGGSVRWTMSSSTGMHSYRVTIRPCEMGHALDDFSPSYAVFVVEDITAQVAAKKLVVNFRTELEREIRQKTADLQEANARLVKLSRQTLSIQEAERSRVARALHDGIGQSLTPMKFYIDNLLSDNAQQNPSWPLKEVTWLRDRVSHAIGETRRIAMNLRPAMLDDLGLGPTLSWFFREYQESIGSIRVRSHVAPDEAGLDPERKTAIFRVVQEALCNVAKHANASEVRVQLAVVNGSHALLIVDNGQGFDPSRVSRHAGGHGLDDIRQRVKMTGGALKIIAAKGAGVKLVARWR